MPVPPPAPCGPVPSERQRDRLRLEACALVHLGIPTFLKRDFAIESDDRSVFRIDAFDASSWVEDLRAMGLDGLVLAVRDADGFSLDGTEILPAAAHALAGATIPFGISLGGPVGDASLAAEVGSLCERFGPFFEMRLGSDVSPETVDARGVACADAVVTSREGPDFITLPVAAPVPHDGETWQGVERSVSIRPSWYWRAIENERLQSVAELEDAWFASVGQGEPLLLGIPADRTGRFPRGDVARVVELRRRLAVVFDRDLASDARASAASERGGTAEFAATRAVDGLDATYWATDDGTDEATIELAWDAPTWMNVLELREPDRLGFRCQRWIAEARVDGAWRGVAQGSTIGFRRTVRFPTVRADSLRVRVGTSGCPPVLSRLAVFAAPPNVRVAGDERTFRNEAVVTLQSDHPDARFRYTLDGRDPLESGEVTDRPIAIDSSCLLRAVAIDPEGRAGHPISARFTRSDGESFLEAVSGGGESGESGLVLEFHDGVQRSLDELGARTLRSTGFAADVRLPADRPADRFALRFLGYLRVPEDGLYTFSLNSDDGSRLYLHDRLVVDRDGVQIYDTREGRVALRRGLHPIRVEYCEFDGRESLLISWSVAGAPLERIPAEAFAR